MKFTKTELQAIPRALLEQLEIAPIPHDGQDSSSISYVFCLWSPDDDEKRAAAISVLHEFIPAASFEFVQPIEEDPKARLKHLLNQIYAGAPATDPRAPLTCSECQMLRPRVIEGRDGCVCARCLRTRFALADNLFECSLCDKPVVPMRWGKRLTICEGCFQLALGMIGTSE